MNENASWAGIGAGIIATLDNRVLLVQINYGRAKGKWILPGGTVDIGEHPEQAAQRELLEETGLTGKVTGLLGIRHRLQPEHRQDSNIYYVFTGELDEDSKIDSEAKLKWDPEELMDVKFWPIKDAIKAEAVAPMTRFFIEKYSNSSYLLEKQVNANAGRYQDSVFCI